MPSVQLSIVVPLFNEESILLRNAEEIAAEADRIIGEGQWQFVLVENGSRDSTPEIIEKTIIPRWPLTKLVTLARPNYGEALRAGLKASDTPYAHIINIEQWDMVFLEWAWQYRGKYALILGSKRADPTINFQSPYRRFLSWGLNCLLQLFFEYVAADTHGIKLLDMRAMRPILEQTVMSRGQFDTEFTIRTMKAGLWVAEAPIVYREQRPPRNFMIKKILQNVIDIWRLKKLLQPIPYAGYLNLHRYSRTELEEASQHQPKAAASQ